MYEKEYNACGQCNGYQNVDITVQTRLLATASDTAYSSINNDTKHDHSKVIPAHFYHFRPAETTISIG